MPADDPGQGAVPNGVGDVGLDVLRRDGVRDAGCHSEEGADPVEGLPRAVDDLPVAQQQDLLPRHVPVQIAQLLPVAAEPAVVPERRPPGGDPLRLEPDGGREVRFRLEARLHSRWIRSGGSVRAHRAGWQAVRVESVGLSK